MPFTIACPKCDAKLKAPESLVGKTVKCPRCSAVVLVQEPKSTAVAAAPRLELPPADPPAGRRALFGEDDAPRAAAPPFEVVDELPEVEDEPVIEEAELDEAVAADDDDYGRPRRRRRSGGVSQDERQMAMFIYLLGIFTHFIGPLVLWMMKRDESKFIDFHGKEMLNFSITWAIAALCLFVVGGPFVVITFGLGAFVVVPLFAALNIYGLVMIIMGAMKANQGEWYEFPISMRLIK